MKKIFFVLLVFSSWVLADQQDNMMHHSYEDQQNIAQHKNEKFIDGDKFGVDKNRFNNFVKNLSNVQVAIISVQGMVCDFCARGIEKTFKKDSNVINIDVDLNKGKVLVAYSKNSEIDFADIKEKITANGQNAINMEVITL